MALREQIKELRTQRVDLVKKSRAILDKAASEKRELSADEKGQWDKMMEEVDSLKERFDTMERQLGAEDEVERDDDEPAAEDEEERDDDVPPKEDDDEEGERSAKPFRLKDGRMVVPVGKREKRNRARPSGKQDRRRPAESEDNYRSRVRRSTPEYRAAFEAYLVNGMPGLSGKHARAISADNDIVGGYMVAPQEFSAQLIKFVDNIVFFRQKATKYVVASAQSLGAPSLDTDISDADWTSELATGNEDSSMTFGKRELTPHPLAKRIKISNKLIRSASSLSPFSNTPGGGGGGAEGIARDRLGYKFGVTEEKAFLTGNGVQKPLGVYTASSRGISTARDVQTGLSTGFTADGLIDAKYSLKAQYQNTAEWLFHRDGYKLIRKLKDGIGQYLWAPGLSAGDPDTLLDRPVNLSEYNPNTFTSGQYVGLFGDFKFYWIVDAETMQLQRLVELYAEANQIGLIARIEMDGMPVLEEAWARLITN